MNPERRPLGERLGLPPGVIELTDEERSQSIAVGTVSIEGNTLYTDDVLSGVVGDIINRTVKVGDIYDASAEVQAYYRSRGYVFTRTRLEADQSNPINVTIRVVEGLITDVTVEESDGIVGEVIELLRDMAGQLNGLSNPHIGDIERVLLLMNDLPGIRATGIPRRSQGAPERHVSLVINVERAPVSAVAFVDNYQSPAAGPGTAGAQFSLQSYSRWADTTRMLVIGSFGSEARDFKERRAILAAHTRYFGSDGLNVTFNGYYTKSDLGDVLDPLGFEGTDYGVGVRAEYPFWRTRPTSLSAYAGLEVSQAVNEALDGQQRLNEDRLRVLSAGVKGRLRDNSGFIEFDMGVEKGVTILNSSRRGDSFLSRADGDPDGALFFVEVERDQRIYEGLSFNGLARAQYATEPLLSSMEFQAGGTNFGRGFDPSEISGDRGIGLTGEVRYTTGMDFVPLQAAADWTVQAFSFFDYARVSNQGTGSLPEGKIQSYGGGLRMFLPNNLFAEVEVAKPHMALRRTNSADPSVFFSIQKRF